MTVSVCFKVKQKTRDGKWAKKPSSVNHYKISVPWQAFMVRMNRVGAITDTFMWFMKNNPVDASEQVYIPPLPNIYPSGHICNGTIKVNFEDPPYLKVFKAFEAFWTTPFTEETWPEWEEVVPPCWNADKKHFRIEYGYLKYIFEYWQEHDQKHSTKKWMEMYGPCPGVSPDFPWGTFRIYNKSHPNYGDYVKTLDQAINYALTFVPMKRQD
jgi:hypothetical protein